MKHTSLARFYTWQCKADKVGWGGAVVKDLEEGFSIMQVEMQAMETTTVPELQEVGIEIHSSIVRDSDKLHCKHSPCNY